jgi:hypothetical protein
MSRKVKQSIGKPLLTLSFAVHEHETASDRFLTVTAVMVVLSALPTLQYLAQDHC